ncbi:AraC family transcriptional regulator [Thalassospira alkalitolerans]|uniref:AraC family transcriptional regulator n=1 Tax=Thalassospira alkalitolerans TaxID=1293890 RepID=A0A1Y2LD33_9PROT|nr:AraC family transcriptional regulator [Thalassospira alkalitolerans]|tara:strand:+ start:187305 stop:188153 length:849 start_codon:yes stop_codon:yes gene_type:complete
MAVAKAKSNNQRFWRDAALPFVEAQRVRDGRGVCYEKHSHDTFSIGAITGGASTCWNRGHSHDVQTGSVVVINPEDVHACNPVDGVLWSYQMIYVDTVWLRDLQVEIGADVAGDFAMFGDIIANDPAIYRDLTGLGHALFDRDRDALGKETAMVSFFTGLQGRLDRRGGRSDVGAGDNRKMRRAASYIRAHCADAVTLADICSAAGVSPSYLVRAFKQAFGMTPHAFLINCKIQRARHALKRGERIVDVAFDCGFADQAHFQRVFKRLMAVTPRQYALAQAA